MEVAMHSNELGKTIYAVQPLQHDWQKKHNDCLTTLVESGDMMTPSIWSIKHKKITTIKWKGYRNERSQQKRDEATVA